MEAKRDRMAHLLNADQTPSGQDEPAELNGQFCYWDHDGEPLQPIPASVAKGGMDLPPGLKEAVEESQIKA